MNMTRCKSGISLLLAAFLCVSTGGVPLVAEQTSDFEKLLQEAIQSNKEGPIAEPSDKKIETPVPKALPAKDSTKVAARVAPAEKPVQTVSGGWTAVTSHPESKTPAVKPAVIQPTVEPIAVADSRIPEPAKKAPEVSVWDAVPEVVSPEGDAKQETEKTAEKTGSAWDAADKDDEAKAPLDWNAAATEAPEKTDVNPAAESANPWAAILNNMADTEKKEEPKKEEPKKEEPKPETPKEEPKKEEAPKEETPKKEEAKAEEPKKEEAPKKEESKTEEPKKEEAPKEETPKKEETKVEESKKVEEPKKDETKAETPKKEETKKETAKETPKDKGTSESPGPSDMSGILNALEKDDKGETKKEASKETPKADDEKPGVAKTGSEKTADNEKESVKETAEKTEPKKLPAKDATTKNDAKTETAKTEAVKGEEKQPEKKEPRVPEVIVRELPKQIFPDFDADADETKYQLVDARRVGDVHAPEKIKLMYDEIVNGLKTRNATSRYEMWKGYAKSTLRNTAGLNTGSELDGRCRLNWYKHLFADPIKSVIEVEEFSRAIHHGLSGSHRHIVETMGMIREKMDVPARNDDGVRFLECKTPTEAVNEVKRCLLEAQMAHSRAIATLTQAELAELNKGLVATFCTNCNNGHTIPNRTYGRRLTNMMEKMDKSAMYQASEALLPLTNPSLLALLDRLPEDAFPKVTINGQTMQRLSTSAGDIVISGREGQTIDLDSPEMRDVVCVISLGGNDHFREGTCGLHRPVLAIINLHGNDNYAGSRPGIQGGSILGVSILVDVEGNDTYSAGDVAQGSSIGGLGMLFDFAGSDNYKAIRRAQGHALCGVGLLIDRKGSDKYRAALWAQGFGANGGFGALNDVEGNDHYYCGGMWADSYPEHPGYDGWGQGVGAGLRQVGNGGIGMILDGAGDDQYEVDYFGHGGGYWLGIGVARDFGGNDKRYGTTKTAYSGGPRQHAEWTRFANGFGCHYALGFLFDDEGNDEYGGRIMGTGMAWDLSIGYLCDFNGNDRFTATGGMTQGVGAEGSIGILFSYGGNDEYLGRNQGFASGSVTYHSPSNCGGNISFLINYGGTDKYGSGAKNNSYVQRGSQTGFLIDRPTDREAADELERMKDAIVKREKEIEEYDEMVKKSREEAAAKGRRYAPRTRRPAPISADQLQRLGSVPHFDRTTRTGGKEVIVK